MNRKYDESKDGLKIVGIETTKKGEFVRKVTGVCRGCKGEKEIPGVGTCVRCSGTGCEVGECVYVRGDYMRPDHAFGFKGGYDITDTEDVNRTVRPLKKGALVLVGFSY